MKNKNITKATDTTLSEMRSLIAEIQCLITKDYKHVSEYLNAQMLKEIENQSEKLETEFRKREDEKFN